METLFICITKQIDSKVFAENYGIPGYFFNFNFKTGKLNYNRQVTIKGETIPSMDKDDKGLKEFRVNVCMIFNDIFNKIREKATSEDHAFKFEISYGESFSNKGETILHLDKRERWDFPEKFQMNENIVPITKAEYLHFLYLFYWMNID